MTVSVDVLAVIDRARLPLVERISEAITEDRFVGIIGEAEVGKTHVFDRAASALAADGWKFVTLDLDEVYSANQLAWRWARQLARAVMDDVAFSHVTSLGASMWPASTRGEFVTLPSRIGPEAARLMQMPYPDGTTATGDQELKALADATVKLAQDHGGRVVLAVDHLEAPENTRGRVPHADKLLWTIRSATQQTADLHVAVLCRPAARSLASGPERAYLLDGRWLTIGGLPPIDLSDRLSERESAAALAATRGHPAATHELVTEMLDGEPPVPGHKRRGVALDTAIGRIASRHVALAGRFLQHAFSLHRLGGHLVHAIARGEGPYTGSPNIDPSLVGEAVRRLDLAGLIAKPDREKTEWVISDPRVTWVLTRQAAWVLARPNRPDDPIVSPLDRLSDTFDEDQRSMLEQLLAGATNDEIAERQGVSRATVARSLRRIYDALGVNDRQQALERLRRPSG
jgi:DNA-binding CsgD family transcriptional regulator